MEPGIEQISKHSPARQESSTTFMRTTISDFREGDLGNRAGSSPKGKKSIPSNQIRQALVQIDTFGYRHSSKAAFIQAIPREEN